MIEIENLSKTYGDARVVVDVTMTVPANSITVIVGTSGSGKTTVLRMVNAYSILANQGRELKPTVIDFVQDRRGKVILPENWRACDGCNAADWDGKPMPRPQIRSRQVMDAIGIPGHFASADAPDPEDIGWIYTQWAIGRQAAANGGRAGGLLVLDEVQKIRDWSDVFTAAIAGL